jgi:hypothetical protein
MGLQGWRPIDTAPEDSDVLVFSPAWGALIARLNAEHDEWSSRMQCPASLAGEREQPTHWMPLPPPPEGATEIEPSRHEREPSSPPVFRGRQGRLL